MCVRIYIIHACTCDLCCLYDPINSTARWISLMLVFRFCFLLLLLFFRHLFLCSFTRRDVLVVALWRNSSMYLIHIICALWCCAIFIHRFLLVWNETLSQCSVLFFFLSAVDHYAWPQTCTRSIRVSTIFSFAVICFFFLCVCAVVVGHFCFRRYECCWLAPQQTKRTVNGWSGARRRFRGELNEPTAKFENFFFT